MSPVPALPHTDSLHFRPLDRGDPTLRRFLSDYGLDLEQPIPLRPQPRPEPWMLYRTTDPCLLGLAWGALSEPPQTLGFYLWIAPPFRGHSWATQAGRALLETAFTAWGCHRVETACRMNDAAGTRLAERLQMLPEGVQRQAWQDDEGRHDLAHYGLLESDPRSSLEG